MVAGAVIAAVTGQAGGRCTVGTNGLCAAMVQPARQVGIDAAA